MALLLHFFSVLFLLMSLFHRVLALELSYVLPPDDVWIVGQDEIVLANYKDTLSDIARQHGLGFNEIIQANPKVNAWVPGAGTKVVLPKRRILPNTPREGLVLNLPEMRLYYYPKPQKDETPMLITYPVSIGRLDWNTPMGLTEIISKIKNPTWTPPESIKKEHAAEGDILPDVVPAGPDNPLGLFALRLGKAGYLIHGTDKPWGIGMRVTHGCMRLYPEDIEMLFQKVVVGTPVRLVNQPFKVGWLAGILYLQVFPPLEEDEKKLDEENELIKIISQAVEGRPKNSYRIDGAAIRRAKAEQKGVLIEIGREL